MPFLRAVILFALVLVLAACAPIPPAQPPATPVSAEPTAALPAARMANPASVYCESQGGRVEIVTDAQGAQSGVCVLPGGDRCDEWAFYRGECGPAAQPTAPANAQDPANAHYELPDIGSFELKEGKYEQPAGEGATQARIVGLNASAAGDLDGDGKQDAVAELWANTGGSGVFHYLVALLNKDGALRQAASTLLGDRVRLNRLGIEPGGVIRVDYLGQGPQDALCCPSQPFTRTYRLDEGALKLLTEVGATPTPR